MMIEIQMRWMGEKPFYVRDIYFTDKPTLIDRIGCHGIYVKRVEFYWWIEPIFEIHDLFQDIKDWILRLLMINL